jgi:hypothetical protein
MASNQPGETPRKYARTSPAGALLIQIKPFQPFPPSRGHAASATASTPGTTRKCSATWFHMTGDWASFATVSSVRSRSAEKPVG